MGSSVNRGEPSRVNVMDSALSNGMTTRFSATTDAAFAAGIETVAV